MSNNQNILRLIQSHKRNPIFDYNLAVDWAYQLLNSGVESENIYMLASFSKPVDSSEIKPYISAVLDDLNLVEKDGNDGAVSEISYYLTEIVDDQMIRSNLQHLYRISLSTNYGFGLMPFYLLYHAWLGLDEDGVNYYYEGANTSNIGKILKKEAYKWLENYNIK